MVRQSRADLFSVADLFCADIGGGRHLENCDAGEAFQWEDSRRELLKHADAYSARD